jgi:hypothetical protein
LTEETKHPNRKVRLVNGLRDNLRPQAAMRTSASKTPEPSRSSAMRYNQVPTSARDLPAGDSHDRRSEVRNPFCRNLALHAEADGVGLFAVPLPPAGGWLLLSIGSQISAWYFSISLRPRRYWPVITTTSASSASNFQNAVLSWRFTSSTKSDITLRIACSSSVFPRAFGRLKGVSSAARARKSGSDFIILIPLENRIETLLRGMCRLT